MPNGQRFTSRGSLIGRRNLPSKSGDSVADFIGMCCIVTSVVCFIVVLAKLCLLFHVIGQ